MYVKEINHSNGDLSEIRVIMNDKKVVTLKASYQSNGKATPTDIVEYARMNDKPICRSVSFSCGGDIKEHLNLVATIHTAGSLFYSLLDLEKEGDTSLEDELKKLDYELSPDRFF
jgi:hypothetical protein